MTLKNFFFNKLGLFVKVFSFFLHVSYLRGFVGTFYHPRLYHRVEIRGRGRRAKGGFGVRVTVLDNYCRGRRVEQLAIQYAMVGAIFGNCNDGYKDFGNAYFNVQRNGAIPGDD